MDTLPGRIRGLNSFKSIWLASVLLDASCLGRPAAAFLAVYGQAFVHSSAAARRFQRIPALLGKPDAANAAFGSARAAVTSAPDVNLEKLSEATQVDELLKLSPKKLRQVQSALGPNEIDNILKEIDQRREVLTAQKAMGHR